MEFPLFRSKEESLVIDTNYDRYEILILHTKSQTLTRHENVLSISIFQHGPGDIKNILNHSKNSLPTVVPFSDVYMNPYMLSINFK